MADPLNHVLRSELPWRQSEHHRTECGLRADSYPTWTRDELIANAKRLGQQRTALVVCMTCLSTAQRWPAWDEDPVRAIGRETYMLREPECFRDELVAIAALIEAHRDEFDELLAGVGQTVSLSDRRRAAQASKRGVRRG